MSGSYPNAVLADGPVGYWRLGEPAGSKTAADSSGGGHVGTAAAGVSFATPGALPGDTNTAARFPGTSGTDISVADTAGLRLNANFTIEFWAKQGTFIGDWPGLLAKGQSYQPGDGYEIYETADGAVHFKRDTKDYMATPAGALTADRYNYFAVTYDGATLRWYVNATQVSATPVTFAANTDTSPLLLGQGVFKGNNTLDEIALYQKPLTPTQITNHHRAATT
jgi:hypothetical protein